MRRIVIFLLTVLACTLAVFSGVVLRNRGSLKWADTRFVDKKSTHPHVAPLSQLAVVAAEVVPASTINSTQLAERANPAVLNEKVEIATTTTWGPAYSMVERPCKRKYSSTSSRPGVPCLPPADSYYFNESTPWRLALGERIVKLVTPNITEEDCNGFKLMGDHTWCLKAMLYSGPEALALSYGIEVRDLFSETMSNVFRMPTQLYDCWIPLAQSPPMAGRAPNGTNSCRNVRGHCYEVPYRSFRVCLGPKKEMITSRHHKGHHYETLEAHLQGRGPLSTYVKIDTEGTEFAVLDWLLSSPADMDKIRTLEFEVHFSRIPESEPLVSKLMPEQERVEKRVNILERLLDRFYCTGSTLEVLRERHKPMPCRNGCPEPCVHTPSMSVDQFAVSYVNRALVV